MSYNTNAYIAVNHNIFKLIDKLIAINAPFTYLGTKNY
jgi:hypothetical protein